MVPVSRQGEAFAAVFAGVAGLPVHVGYMLVEVRLGLERFTAGRTAVIRISVPKLELRPGSSTIVFLKKRSFS